VRRPGEQSDEFVSYHRLEVAIWDAAQRKDVRELLIPDEVIVDLEGGRTRTFTSPELPFELELSGYLRNARPMPMADDGDRYRLAVAPEALENEKNLPAVSARFRDPATGKTGEAPLWSVERHPATFEAGGKTWAVSLRRERYSMPFTIRLEDFRKEDHPGMSMARSFESDVIKIEDGREEQKLIQMNDPLRAGGLVLFQSSYGQDEMGRSYSVFSVVRNPSDYWPEYACWVIAAGLLLAFLPRLWSFIVSQHQRRKKSEVVA